MIYDTVPLSPQIRHYRVPGLTPYLNYRFYVVAYNFNGGGASSDIAFLKPCSLPSMWAKPHWVSNTKTQIKISWNEPRYNGECHIYSYAVFVDDGSGDGEFVEANVDNDISVRNIPSMSTATITRNVDQADSLGKVFRIKVRAFNPAGYIDSPIIGVRLSVVPSQPPAPTKIVDLSSQSRITIDISQFDFTTMTGGCPVQSFEIQMDDGEGGYYRSMAGYLAPYMTPIFGVTSGIERGLTYRFRYRARNCKGWGPFSDELYVLAAQKPTAPPSP